MIVMDSMLEKWLKKCGKRMHTKCHLANPPNNLKLHHYLAGEIKLLPLLKVINANCKESVGI